MTDLSNLAQNVINVISSTIEYQNYLEAINELKQDDALLFRVNQMRERNYLLQQAGGEDLLEKMDELTSEYEDVINNEAVSRFLAAEAGVCKMIQEFYDTITNGLEFD